MTVWFTSDHHFGHDNIRKLCNRPFESLTEMNEELIRRWNAAVKPNDTVWHLGDFSYRSERAPSDLLRRLHGHKHLVWGNHDGEQTRDAPEWVSVSPYAEILVDRDRIVLCHYAFRTWNKSGRGAINLYGHSHGNLPGNSQSLDVGVDCWDYRPVTLDQIKKRLAKLPVFRSPDHHGDKSDGG